MSKETCIVVIGGGAAGLTTAVGLAKVGYRPILIEGGTLGGVCTNVGCVPSKTLLYEARKFSNFKVRLQKVFQEKHNKPVQEVEEIKKSLQEEANRVLEKVRVSRQSFYKEEDEKWLEEQGVGLIKGMAYFTGKKSLSVDKVTYTTEWIKEEHAELVQDGFLFFDKCVIATGSSPRIPEIEGLKDVNYLTNESVFELKEIPDSLSIIGDGPIAIEMANAFANLGTEVTVIGLDGYILANIVDREISQLLKKNLRNKGVYFAKGIIRTAVKEGNKIKLVAEDDKEYRSTAVLIASGRNPNLNLNLGKAEVDFNSKGIKIDKYSETSTTNIYAVGDCARVPRFTHFADYQARQLVANLALRHYVQLPIQTSYYKKNKVPAVIYTDYEVAQYGFTEAKAHKKWKESVQVHRLPFEQLDRAKMQGNEPGMIKVITKGFLGRIVGVSIMAKRAGEMLPEFQRLIDSKAKLSTLAGIIRPYPGYSSNLDVLYNEWVLKKLPVGKIDQLISE